MNKPFYEPTPEVETCVIMLDGRIHYAIRSRLRALPVFWNMQRQHGKDRVSMVEMNDAQYDSYIASNPASVNFESVVK